MIEKWKEENGSRSERKTTTDKRMQLKTLMNKTPAICPLSPFLLFHNFDVHNVRCPPMHGRQTHSREDKNRKIKYQSKNPVDTIPNTKNSTAKLKIRKNDTIQTRNGNRIEIKRREKN